MTTPSQYISVRETAQLLGVSEKKVMEMIDNKELQAYKIANQFLRLKKAEVLELRSSGTVVNETVQYPYTTAQRIGDFFYFNDFYLFSALLIAALIFVVWRF